MALVALSEAQALRAGGQGRLATRLPCLILNTIGFDRPAPAQKGNVRQISDGIGGQVRNR